MSGFSKTGQLDALRDAAIAARVPESRRVLPGTGVSGGGPLEEDVTVSIASFTGLISKSVNPPSQLYPKGTVTTIAVYDVGDGGMLIPIAFQLPAAAAAGALRPQIAFQFSDGTVAVRFNNNTGGTMGDGIQGCANILMNDAQAGQPALNDGKRVRKIKFEVHNSDAVNDQTADLGMFRVNAYAVPRGGGTLTVT